MKKMLTLIAFLTFSTGALAAEGGFKAGETPPPAHQQDAGTKGTEDTAESSVASLATQRANAWVTLEGYVIRKEGAESYIFRDETASIRITVSRDAWAGKEYTAKDLVRVSGYVKGDGKSRYVQAGQIKEP